MGCAKESVILTPSPRDGKHWCLKILPLGFVQMIRKAPRVSVVRPWRSARGILIRNVMPRYIRMGLRVEGFVEVLVEVLVEVCVEVLVEVCVEIRID